MNEHVEAKLVGFSDKAREIVINSPLIKLVEESETKRLMEEYKYTDITKNPRG